MNRQTLPLVNGSISRLLNSPLQPFVEEFFLDALPLSLVERKDSYPKYNIVRKSDEAGEVIPESFSIELAVAGFSKEDLEITTEENELRVKTTNAGFAQREYLYKGIAERTFNWGLKLPEYSIIENVSLELGILKIEVKIEVPEEKKPKTYTIA